MTADAQQPQREPVNKGELEYGSILPNGEDWRLRKFDAGMGESEYRIFKNETFFAMFDNRKDADMIMGLMTRPQTPAPEPLKDCHKCSLPCTHTGKESAYDSKCPEFRFGNQRADQNDLIVRKELLDNSVAMEVVLRRNECKGTWKTCTLEYLFNRIQEELQEAIEDYEDRDMVAVSRELLDVENFCMMFRDVESLRAEQEAQK